MGKASAAGASGGGAKLTRTQRLQMLAKASVVLLAVSTQKQTDYSQNAYRSVLAVSLPPFLSLLPPVPSCIS